MSDRNDSDILSGTTLKIYLFLIKKGRPVGVREVQRALKLSSASVAVYHLNKLEEAEFVQKEKGNYTTCKVMLKDKVRVSHYLIPRYFFYAIFTALILIIELAFFKPAVLDRGYFVFAVAMAILLVLLSFETLKKWLEGGI
ncbi:MAG: winged helix-turn-helix domain-containing protein [Candidatus Bathyarchaeota archaeon]|nr:winged helix-turn-helix domain-containing protein [Candidatus Bathyarchaeum tardum]